MKKYLFAIIVFYSGLSFSVFGQERVKVQGVVTEINNEVLPGVNVYPKTDQGRGVTTDLNGKYELTVNPGTVLVFSFIGLQTQEVTVGTAANQTINVVMEESSQQLEEVTIVGYGAQRKVSVVGAISTIKPAELQRGAISSVSNTLTGRIAGLIGVQSSGEPGSDVTEFWVRGISTFGGGAEALILIDGIERGSDGLNDLAPEDIESFSILKDASATAVYGARGANGVIIINTKRGHEGKIQINGNFKGGMEWLPRLPEYLEAYDYAKLANEARIVRGNSPVYSPEIFDIIKYKMDPDLFPDVNWQKEILKKYTYAAQGNINIAGGGKLARYYMSGFYRSNDAIYKQTGMDRYNTNVRRKQYSFRSNIDVDVTKTTKVSLLLAARLVDQNRPGIGETSTIWNAVTNITPLLVPVKYSNGLFPSYGQNNQTSPTILLNETGYRTIRENTIETVLNLNQDLSILLDGLKISGSLSFDNYNYHLQVREKMPDLYMAVDRNWQTGELLMAKTVVARNLDYLTGSYGKRTIYIEGRINYDKIFNEKHRVGVLFLYQQRDFERTDVYTELASIPHRYQGIAGRLTYSYNDIYFLEGNFGYNGSENFPKGQRFGFFPSIALGYVVSNYQYVKDNFPFVNMLKLRYSYGLVGNDKILKNGAEVRFPYLTTVNSTTTGYIFGDVPSYYLGSSDAVLGSTGLVWESARKQNWGIDLLLWNSLNVVVDAYIDKRNNIFMPRQQIPGTVGVQTDIWGNVGKMKSWGTDGTASYTRQFGDWVIEVRGNYTLTREKIIEYDEVLPRYPYLGQKGMAYGLTRGLIALGLFENEDDVRNSPQQFGEVLPGDIKYQDVNGDGVIDSYDIVPIGNASGRPRFSYGIAGSVIWKGIDFNVFFRGASKRDFFLGGTGYYPFAGEKLGNVLTVVNDQANRWTPASYSGDPSTENPNARFPRLTYGHNTNNNRSSTFWLADASFLRLKTMEIGYTFPKQWSQKIAMNNLRISLIGDNLHLWDKVKLFDPEQASSNGSVYPLTRSVTFVLQMSF
jgi:TonB-linked SusC/RagA family outer membrane protein